jgi:hypothetical protein
MLMASEPREWTEDYQYEFTALDVPALAAQMQAVEHREWVSNPDPMYSSRQGYGSGKGSMIREDPSILAGLLIS